MKRFNTTSTLFACVLCCITHAALPTTSIAQTSNTQLPGGVNVFAGYSFIETDHGIDALDAYGTSGFHLEATRFFTPKIGVGVEFSGHYGASSPDIEGITGLSSDQYTFLVGPRLNSRSFWKIRLSTRALIGLSMLDLDTDQDSISESLDGTESSFAIALGASVDLVLSDRISLRLIQSNKFYTYFGDGLQANNRYSSGVVIQF